MLWRRGCTLVLALALLLVGVSLVRNGCCARVLALSKGRCKKPFFTRRNG